MWCDWKTDMAGLDRAPLKSLLVIVSVMLVQTSCSSGIPKPLEAPAGTSASAPQPDSVEAPTEVDVDTDPYELAAPSRETVVDVPEPDPEPEDGTLVTIDTGAKDVTERKPSLAQVAQTERDRRQIADPTGIVITDETLEKFATGDLTVVESSASQDQALAELSKFEEEMAEKEAYWRGGVREIRQAWRDAYDKIPELEEKIFQLRQEFYREDNGFYRDGEIKPAWDRAIDQLEEARLDVEAHQKELTAFLEEGREAGALPGWLREGIDLEPVVEEVRDDTAEPGEPVIYEPEATDPP